MKHGGAWGYGITKALYECPLCHETFRYIMSLKKHSRKMHPDKDAVTAYARLTKKDGEQKLRKRKG